MDTLPKDFISALSENDLPKAKEIFERQRPNRLGTLVGFSLRFLQDEIFDWALAQMSVSERCDFLTAAISPDSLDDCGLSLAYLQANSPLSPECLKELTRSARQAVEVGKLNIFKQLLTIPNIQVDMNEMLRVACKKGQLNMAEYLLTCADPKDMNHSSLYCAALREKPDLISLLIKHTSAKDALCTRLRNPECPNDELLTALTALEDFMSFDDLESVTKTARHRGAKFLNQSPTLQAHALRLNLVELTQTSAKKATSRKSKM